MSSFHQSRCSYLNFDISCPFPLLNWENDHFIQRPLRNLEESFSLPLTVLTITSSPGYPHTCHYVLFPFNLNFTFTSPLCYISLTTHFNCNLSNIFWSLKSIFLITISLPLKAFLPLTISTQYSLRFSYFSFFLSTDSFTVVKH